MKGLIFTFAMAYGGSVVALFRPWYGLLIYVSFSIIRPDSVWWYSVPRGPYSRIVAIGLLAGWVFAGFGSWQFGRASRIVWAAIGYQLWSVLSALQAVDQNIAWSQ